jgi:hypothetical protein
MWRTVIKIRNSIFDTLRRDMLTFLHHKKGKVHPSTGHENPEEE